MNYEEHVLGGIITYPLVILIASLLKVYLNVPFQLSAMAMMLGYAFYVLGSDLPDIDHPDAIIHKGTKPLVAVAIGSSAFLKLKDITLTSYDWANLTIAWAISSFVAFASWYVFSAVIPRHRGIVHSIGFGIIYGIVSFLVVVYGLGLKLEEGAFIGFAAFMGYLLHLILDKHIKLI
ncbi:metal-dependent hydrolase [Thermococcus sp. M39]|uniref:metal-dependent hydrolase n=1 Tax=unclassified Thermococcus TaxID=2627626 RepID=UPI00143C7D81|nr:MULTISPECIES: metal-dependent hydrolase [unclassified Thermococcus]NJE08076.1 metal-dependent hydrolase [Thermococcus sp. M39]NJE11569.1 metal-dependent hydrolase [Thermococcus sp. LS2]